MDAAAVLVTKIEPPRPRAGHVPRERLLERLARSERPRLTLLVAPAGSGKSTLLAEWRAATAGEEAFAWLGLDAADNDPARFWTHLLAALTQAGAELPPGLGDALAARGARATEVVLPPLVNALAAARAELVLVLDDYHVIGEPEIHEGVAFLLAAPPGGRPPRDRIPHAAAARRRTPARRRAARRHRRRRAALQRGGGGLAAQRHARAGAPGRRSRAAARAHGGLGGRALPGRPLAARRGRPQRGDRGLLGQRSAHRRLPRRGVAGGSRRRDPRLPARDVDPRRPDAGALRCAARGRRVARAARPPRALQPLPHPARRRRRVVPLPPPLPGRAAAPARALPRARATSPRCTRGPLPGTRRAVTRRPRSATGSRAASRSAPPSSSRATGTPTCSAAASSTARGWLDALPEELVLADPQLSLARAWVLFDSGEFAHVERWAAAAEAADDGRAPARGRPQRGARP